MLPIIFFHRVTSLWPALFTELRIILTIEGNKSNTYLVFDISAFKVALIRVLMDYVCQLFLASEHNKTNTPLGDLWVLKMAQVGSIF